MKLLSKERIGSKTIKRHSSPKTPYQRILESPFISSSVKQTLTKLLEPLVSPHIVLLNTLPKISPFIV